MGFGKSFGLGLLMYILLNFAMTIVAVAITNATAIGAIFTLDGILAALFSPVLLGYKAFVNISAPGALTLTGIFTILKFILPGLLGSLVAGKSSDSSGAAFGGWLLAPIIVAVILVVVIMFVPITLGLEEALFVATNGQLGIILAGVSVGFLWGGVAAASAGP